MRILANENFPLDAVVSLRAHGHGVCWVRSELPGVTDREVLRRATLEDRLIITFDKDFGELVFKSRLPITNRYGAFPRSRSFVWAASKFCQPRNQLARRLVRKFCSSRSVSGAT